MIPYTCQIPYSFHFLYPSMHEQKKSGFGDGDGEMVIRKSNVSMSFPSGLWCV